MQKLTEGLAPEHPLRESTEKEVVNVLFVQVDKLYQFRISEDI
jgi:hypothetical protein